jgi:DNA-binding NarL/FixJ family response regulator
MSRSEDTPSRIRVLIVDPHEVSRAAIRALLQTEGVEVVADVANGEQALAPGEVGSPAIAILDVGRGARQALEIASALARLPSMPTVVLTSSTAAEGSLDGYAFIAKADLCARELRLAMRPPNHES